jgi:oxidase EvaA
VAHWQQPTINQPETGILGILARHFDGVLHFLMQAKMEPGNINMVQLSPTVQATHSNYTRVHQGKTPPYLDFFLQSDRNRVVADVLQSEQGARFLKKHNRNMVVWTDLEVEVLPDFRWFTLGELHELMARNNIVNMDARTVLGCLPPPDESEFDAVHQAMQACPQPFRRRALQSLATMHGYNSYQHLLNWFTEQRVNFFVHGRSMPLKDIEGWCRDDRTVRHESGKYFSIIACRIEATSREVSAWTQPLLSAASRGLLAFIVRDIGGVLHLLVQAKPEAGVVHQVELAPTVLCMPEHYCGVTREDWPPFLANVLDAPAEFIRYDAAQSEEGGRFFREENRNVIVEVGQDFPLDLPQRFVWMTVRQIKEFVRHSHCVNIQARCLLASMGAI